MASFQTNPDGSSRQIFSFEHGPDGSLRPLSIPMVAYGIFVRDLQSNYDALLSGFDWVDDFLNSNKKRIRRREISEELTILENALPSKDEMITRIKGDAAILREKRLSLLTARYLDRKYGLEHLVDRFADQKLPLFISSEEVEEICKRIPGKVDQRERDRRLKALYAEDKALEDELQGLNPPKYSQFTFYGQDCRKLFVDHWRRLQDESKGPVGPLGHPLAACDEQIRQAWKKIFTK